MTSVSPFPLTGDATPAAWVATDAAAVAVLTLVAVVGLFVAFADGTFAFPPPALEWQ